MTSLAVSGNRMVNPETTATTAAAPQNTARDVPHGPRPVPGSGTRASGAVWVVGVATGVLFGRRQGGDHPSQGAHHPPQDRPRPRTPRAGPARRARRGART